MVLGALVASEMAASFQIQFLLTTIQFRLRYSQSFNLMGLRTTTDNNQRHVVYERASGREVLDRTQNGKQQPVGRVSPGPAQLRLDPRIAKLLVGFVDRLEDAV